jgi:hypothetical protein
MTAWVLIIALGATGVTSVSGIESEQECRALAAKLEKEWTMFAPPMKCFPYRGALAPEQKK